MSSSCRSKFPFEVKKVLKYKLTWSFLQGFRKRKFLQGLLKIWSIGLTSIGNSLFYQNPHVVILLFDGSLLETLRLSPSLLVLLPLRLKFWALCYVKIGINTMRKLRSYYQGCLVLPLLHLQYPQQQERLYLLLVPLSSFQPQSSLPSFSSSPSHCNKNHESTDSESLLFQVVGSQPAHF